MKSKVAAFLCNLASENSAAPVFKLLLSLIEYTFTSHNPEDLANYQELIQYQDSLFLSNIFEAETRYEACLLTLACLNKVANNEMK